VTAYEQLRLEDSDEDISGNGTAWPDDDHDAAYCYTLCGLCDGQAVTAYERLRLEDSDENWNDSSSTSRVVARPDDDLGTRFSDYVGLAQRVRDNCRQYSDFMQLAVHRETIYRGKF